MPEGVEALLIQASYFERAVQCSLTGFLFMVRRSNQILWFLARQLVLVAVFLFHVPLLVVLAFLDRLRYVVLQLFVLLHQMIDFHLVLLIEDRLHLHLGLRKEQHAQPSILASELQVVLLDLGDGFA